MNIKTYLSHIAPPLSREKTILSPLSPLLSPLTFLLLFALPSSAQSLDSCLVLAERNNLGVAVADMSVARTRALEGTAFELDPTDITLTQDLTGGGSPDNGITLAQQFALPGLYRARRRQLRAETELERRGRDVVVRQLRRDVSAAYYTLLYRRERVRLLQAQDSVYAEFVRLATAKCRAGETSRLEQLNAERLALDNSLALAQAQADVALAQAQLETLVGTPTPNPSRREGGATPETFPSSEAYPTTEIFPTPDTTTPEAAYLAQQVTVGELTLQTIRREALPKVSVGLTGQLVLSGINPYNVDRSRFTGGELMAFEVGVSVPLSFGAMKARKRAATAAIEVARLRQRQAGQLRDGQLRQARTRLEQAERTLRAYTDAGARVADIAHTSTVAYEHGEVGYIEHTQNLKLAIDHALSQAEALHEYHQAAVSLRYM